MVTEMKKRDCEAETVTNKTVQAEVVDESKAGATAAETVTVTEKTNVQSVGSSCVFSWASWCRHHCLSRLSSLRDSLSAIEHSYTPR